MKKNKKIQKVYTTFYKLLVTMAIKQVGNVQNAEDICQEVFIAYSKKVDQVTNVKIWLIGALRIQILKFFKSKQSKQSTTDDIDIYVNTLAKENDSNLEINIILNDVLEKENDLHRQIFELRNLYGWSLTSIAKELNMTRRQVRYIYEKILRGLLVELKRKGISAFEDIV